MQSSNHSGILWSWSCAPCPARRRSKGLKTKFWSTILKSFWDFMILILCSLPSRGVEHRIKKSQNDLRIKLQNFIFSSFFASNQKWKMLSKGFFHCVQFKIQNQSYEFSYKFWYSFKHVNLFGTSEYKLHYWLKKIYVVIILFLFSLSKYC